MYPLVHFKFTLVNLKFRIKCNNNYTTATNFSSPIFSTSKHVLKNIFYHFRSRGFSIYFFVSIKDELKIPNKVKRLKQICNTKNVKL
jgi:hypothetical protein